MKKLILTVVVLSLSGWSGVAMAHRLVSDLIAVGGDGAGMACTAEGGLREVRRNRNQAADSYSKDFRAAIARELGQFTARHAE